MESISLSRGDIRGMLRARCGYSGSDATSGQIHERLNGFIEDANQMVVQRRRWVARKKEYAFTFGVDQRFYNYPPNCTASGIIAIGVWSNGEDTTAGNYVPLYKKPIPLTLDTDPISNAGGDPAVALRGMPTRYELKGQIEVWQRADKPYLGKIDYYESARLVNNDDMSVVDAYTILWFALAMEKQTLGDENAAKKFEKMAEDRLRLLSAWEHHGSVTALDEEAVMERYELADHRVDPVHIVANPRPG